MSDELMMCAKLFSDLVGLSTKRDEMIRNRVFRTSDMAEVEIKIEDTKQLLTNRLKKV